MKMTTIVLVLLIIDFTHGFYINHSGEKSDWSTLEDKSTIEWQRFKKTLGLTNRKVELLKSQKDQKATVDMLNKFIDENPEFQTDHHKEESSDSLLKVYSSIIHKLKLSKRTLKTSLNFELAEKPKKDLKRSRRKISVRMVTDMASDKIDELLKTFNQKHGIDGDDPEIHSSDTDADYDVSNLLLPSGNEPDYMYENLYEDEEDVSTKTQENSLQDLILQAKRNQWHRDFEETKLYNQKNYHFIQMDT